MLAGGGGAGENFLNFKPYSNIIPSRTIIQYYYTILLSQGYYFGKCFIDMVFFNSCFIIMLIRLR